jgi:hypothetical protein
MDVFGDGAHGTFPPAELPDRELPQPR